MSNATNGVRIKAWAGPNVGYGVVNNVTYTDFTAINIDWPIIIDQCYATSAAECARVPSRVNITNVHIARVAGSSSGKRKSVVASLKCSKGGECLNITLDDVSVEPPVKYRPATYVCENLEVGGNAKDLFNCIST